jgi:hypothetical protein
MICLKQETRRRHYKEMLEHAHVLRITVRAGRDLIDPIDVLEEKTVTVPLDFVESALGRDHCACSLLLN